MVKSALCLYHNVLPFVAEYGRTPKFRPGIKGRFISSRSLVIGQKTGLTDRELRGTGAISLYGDCMQVVMSEAEKQTAVNRTAINSTVPIESAVGPLPYGFFVLGGQKPSQLLQQIKQLTDFTNEFDRQYQSTGTAFYSQIGRLAAEWHRHSGKHGKGGRKMSILASTVPELLEYLKKAHNLIETNEPAAMNSRGGICFNPDMDLNLGKIAFVYPGSGNHYIGMGRNLALYWPEVMQSMDAQTERLKSQLLPRWYDPWRTEWKQGWQSETYKELVADPMRTIFGQVLFGGQMTALIQKCNIHPQAVIGYSLGESAGLFAMGAWSDRGQMLDRLATSDLFKSELAGTYQSVRKAWKLSESTSVGWRVAVVNRPAAEVDTILSDIPHVRRLIVNTPEECVIGGLPEAVSAAVERLGCEAMNLDGVVAVHCDAAQPVAQAYKDLHRFDTKPVNGVQFYSVAAAGSYDVSNDSAADSILQQALKGFDFPKTIEQAYADGVRTFIEIGPHNSCTRMIRQILKDRPHLALAANHRNEDECFTLLRCLGTLAAAGADLNYDFIFPGVPADSSLSTPYSPNAIRVRVGRAKPKLPPFPEIEAAIVDRPVEPSRSATAEAPIDRQDAWNEIPNKPQSGQDNDLFNTLNEVLSEMETNIAATAKAHEQFLDLSREMTVKFSEAFNLQNELIAALKSVTPASDGKEKPPSIEDKLHSRTSESGKHIRSIDTIAGYVRPGSVPRVRHRVHRSRSWSTIRNYRYI